MSPRANERPGTSPWSAWARANMDAEESMPTVSAACMRRCSSTVRLPVPQPRSTTRPRGTGVHSATRSSNGFRRSAWNRSYCSGFHPSIGVTVTGPCLVAAETLSDRRAHTAGPIIGGHGRPALGLHFFEPRVSRARSITDGPHQSPRRPEPHGRPSVDRRRPQDPQPPSAERRPRPAEAHHAMELRGRLLPAEPQVLGRHLGRDRAARPAGARAPGGPPAPPASDSTRRALPASTSSARSASRYRSSPMGTTRQP